MRMPKIRLLFLMLVFWLGGLGMHCNVMTAPVVISTSPGDGEDELKLATVIVIRFSEPMDQTSVENAFSIPGVTGSFTWNENGDEMTFTPSALLAEDESYQVTIWDTARDRTRTALKHPYQFGFRTVNLWTRTYSDWAAGFGIAVDEAGNVYSTGFTDWDIWIRKYNKDGEIQWTRTYGEGWELADTGEAIAVDQMGNVYVTGYTESVEESEHKDIWVGKYDPDGNEQWTRTESGTEHGFDTGHGIAVDEQGDIYVIGNEHFHDLGWAVWLRKYDPEGTEQWTKIEHIADEGYDIAVDARGYIYVTGSQYVPGENYNIWIRTYDPSRVEQWTRSYASILDLTSDVYDAGYGIAVDADSNVYVCGKTWGNPFHHQKWIRKYDAAGTVLWTDTHSGPAPWHDAAEDIAVDEEGNVYVVGTNCVGEGDCDIWTRKYDADGRTLWTRTFSGPPQSMDHGYGIAVDRRGNVLVIGDYDTLGHGGSPAVWIRKYDTDGHWAE